MKDLDTKNQNEKRTIRNLTIFSVTVLAVGWIGHWFDILMGNPSSDSLGMLLWIITPLAACIFLRAFAGGGWKDLGIKLNFKGNIKWYIVAVFIFPLATILILILGFASGFVNFPHYSPDRVGFLLNIFVVGLLPGFFKNIFEEFAWRGYLTPKIFSLHLNDYLGHFIVGLIWALWHIPYYLFFLNRATFQSYTSMGLTTFLFLAVLTIISYSLVFGEIRLLTGSIWPVVLMHMVEDAFVNPLLVENFIIFKNGMDFLFSPGVSILAIIFFTAAGVLLRRLRKRRESLLLPLEKSK